MEATGKYHLPILCNSNKPDKTNKSDFKEYFITNDINI